MLLNEDGLPSSEQLSQADSVEDFVPDKEIIFGKNTMAPAKFVQATLLVKAEKGISDI